VLPAGGKARFGLAVPAAEPLRLTCGRDTRPFAAEFEVLADCLPVTGCRWSRLIASWLVVYRCRGLEQHDDANDSNPDPVQPPPDPCARGGHIALVLWPPGEPPVLRSAEGR
jgi:hypothetical protein